MKTFFKPTRWTLTLTVSLVMWQYFYAFRGIDYQGLRQLRSYFGFSLSIVNWDNFLIRTFSLGIIWVIVALIIFFLLLFFESYNVAAHNRRIEKKYVNQPKDDYAHLLRVKNIKFKDHFATQLYLSAGIILIPAGFFMLSGVIEGLREGLLQAFSSRMLESGTFVDTSATWVVATSFLLVIPFWYLLAATDSWCFKRNIERRGDEEIASEHYAIEVQEKKPEDKEDDEVTGSTFSVPPVV